MVLIFYDSLTTTSWNYLSEIKNDEGSYPALTLKSSYLNLIYHNLISEKNCK